MNANLLKHQKWPVKKGLVVTVVSSDYIAPPLTGKISGLGEHRFRDINCLKFVVIPLKFVIKTLPDKFPLYRAEINTIKAHGQLCSINYAIKSM